MLIFFIKNHSGEKKSIGNKNNLITNKYSDAIVSRLSDANVVTERYLSAPDFRNRG